MLVTMLEYIRQLSDAQRKLQDGPMWRFCVDVLKHLQDLNLLHVELSVVTRCDRSDFRRTCCGPKVRRERNTKVMVGTFIRSSVELSGEDSNRILFWTVHRKARLLNNHILFDLIQVISNL